MNVYYHDQEHDLRIIHGDCLEALKDIDEPVDMIVTDPPYGMGKVTGDGSDYLDVVIPALQMSWELLKEGGSMFVFASPREVLNVGDVLPREYFKRMLWMFKVADVCHKHYSWMACSEAILWFAKGKPAFRRRPVVLDTYQVFHDLSEKGLKHPAVKPFSVILDLVLRCPFGGLVLDPFMGTGTTLRACQHAGVRGIGIEIEQRHCDTAVRRLAQRLLPLDLEREWSQMALEVS